jgi:hypothetical protein
MTVDFSAPWKAFSQYEALGFSVAFIRGAIGPDFRLMPNGLAVIESPFDLEEHAEWQGLDMPFFIAPSGGRVYIADYFGRSVSYSEGRGVAYKDGPITVSTFHDVFNEYKTGHDPDGVIREFGVEVPDGANLLKWIVAPRHRLWLPALPESVRDRIVSLQRQQRTYPNFTRKKAA